MSLHLKRSARGAVLNLGEFGFHLAILWHSAIATMWGCPPNEDHIYLKNLSRSHAKSTISPVDLDITTEILEMTIHQKLKLTNGPLLDTQVQGFVQCVLLEISWRQICYISQVVQLFLLLLTPNFCRVDHCHVYWKKGTTFENGSGEI